MKKIEIILPSIFLFACLLYIYHLPGAGVFKTLAALSLGGFYLLISFALFNDIGFRRIFSSESYKSVKAWHILIAIIAGYVLCSAVMSVLFLVMRWPGAFVMTFASTVQLIIVALVCAVLSAIKPLQVYKNILRRVFIFLSLVITLWAVSKMYWELDLEHFKAEIESYK